MSDQQFRFGASDAPGNAEGDMIDRAKARLDQQEAEAKERGEWREGNDSDIVVLGPRRYNPIQVREGKADKEYLFANRNRQILQMRRAEGWRESQVADMGDGETNEIGDLVQMEMPKRQYEHTILAPEIARREARITAIETGFHEAGEIAARETNGGVETFGHIRFDRK